MRKPLFYSDIIQVGNKTVLHRRWKERRVCCICHLLHGHGTFLSLDEFSMKYSLNTDFLTDNGCLQATKKYIKS